jgi:hypothetical protein
MSQEARITKLEQWHEAETAPIQWIIIRYAGEEGPTDEELHRAEEAYIERFGEPQRQDGMGIPCLQCHGGIITTSDGLAYGQPSAVIGTYEVVVRPQGLPGYRES